MASFSRNNIRLEAACAQYVEQLIYRINDAVRKGEPKAERIVGWSQHDVDGTVGADRYSNALARTCWLGTTADVLRIMCSTKASI
jgi:chromosome condensin MukBEF complex kleisin-like MukF subunit